MNHFGLTFTKRRCRRWISRWHIFFSFRFDSSTMSVNQESCNSSCKRNMMQDVNSSKRHKGCTEYVVSEEEPGATSYNTTSVPDAHYQTPSSVTTKPVLRMITQEEFVEEIQTVKKLTGVPLASKEKLAAIYQKYQHRPSSPAREWSAHDNRQVAQMLTEIGFKDVSCVELNGMLPEGATMRNGSKVEAANVLVARGLGQQLGIDMDCLYEQLEAKPMDTLKWSRRAKKFDRDGNATNGKQQKRARHNCCIRMPKSLAKSLSMAWLHRIQRMQTSASRSTATTRLESCVRSDGAVRRVSGRLGTRYTTSSTSSTSTTKSRVVLEDMATSNVVRPTNRLVAW